MEDQGVLPDHHGIHQAAHGEGVVGLEPDHIPGRQVELQQAGDVDEVAEIQHEELTFLRRVLEISREYFETCSWFREEDICISTNLLTTRAVMVTV